MIHHSCYSIEESGPNDDHQTQSPKLQKVVDVEDHFVDWSRGIFGVEKSSRLIDGFIDDIPMLVRQCDTFGLIWNKSLQPSDGKYEPGEHFCSTREPERKSANGSVSFYRDGETGTKFAIKTLQDSDHFHPLEIKIGLVCDSPNLCAVYGVIIRNSKIHILLEHAGSELIKERSWIAASPERILMFAKHSFLALQDFHKCGFVHCDIKPDNIMVVRNHGEDFTVKVVDFGSCQPIGGNLPPDAHTTRFYWSPEIWTSLHNGDQVICQPAMDVYALALTLFFVQTSCHLMNRLQEKDILPLMTQRSEDLLLIALPETIPSGLRAVMRPCLAGKAEDRWSAQQAASQLDGDAMMQKALSNPKGENYKDWFKQMLRNQVEKNRTQSPGLSSSSQSPVRPLQKAESDVQLKAEIHGNSSPIHYFVGHTKGNVVQDLGLQARPSSLKEGIEKKLNPPPKPKRSGSLNNGKRLKTSPKPREIDMKVPAAHKAFGPSNQTEVHNEHEVHYISRDEMMLYPVKLDRRKSLDKPALTVDNLNTSIFMGVSKGEHSTQIDENTKLTSQRELKSATSKEAMDSSLNPPDSDERAFSCSALLKTLATQARFSSDVAPTNSSVPSVSSGSLNQRQTYERDKMVHTPATPHFEMETTPANTVNHFRDSVMISNAVSDECKKRAAHESKRVPNAPLPPKRSTLASPFGNGAKPSSSACQGSATIHQPSKSTPRQEDNEDEMGFVIQALEVPQFTGRAEDIIDNLCHLLDKDERLPTAENKKPIQQHKLIQQRSPATGETYIRNQAQPVLMCSGDKGMGGAVSAGHPLFPYHRRNGRKRISSSDECGIPSKVTVKSSDAQVTDDLLPNFNEILPENNQPSL